MRFAGHAAVTFGVGGFILGSLGAPAKPTVSLVGTSPVIVAGSGYTAGARIVVTYRSGATQVRRRVTVTVAGRFRIVLRGVTFKRCNGLQLSAAGASLRLASCTVVYGAVRIGPITPVCREGIPCDKPAAKVVLAFTHPAARVRVVTDARGMYRARLNAGVWTVRSSAGMRTKPVRIAVPRAPSWRRNFSIDTGIR